MKKTIALMMLLCMLVACSRQPVEHICVCGSGKDLLSNKVEFVSLDDVLLSETEYDAYSFEALNITEEDTKQEGFLDEMARQYASVFDLGEGLEVHCDVVNDNILFTVTLHFDKVDLDHLVELGIIDDHEDGYVSYEKRVASFNAIEGINCK